MLILVTLGTLRFIIVIISEDIADMECSIGAGSLGILNNCGYIFVGGQGRLLGTGGTLDCSCWSKCN